MKKQLITFLIIFFILPALKAADIYFNITPTQTVAEIQAGIQSKLDNAASGDRVIVTGSKTDVNTMLELYIATGKTVVWQATYQSGASFSANSLIAFMGNGKFEVADGELITKNAHAINASGTGITVIVSGTGTIETSGDGVHAIWGEDNVEIKDHAQISGTTGEVIFSDADNATITVSGGTVTATSENAICAMGRDVKILVTGGYLSNNANDTYPTIVAVHSSPDSKSLVHISGSGKVEAKGMGCAIISGGTVRVSGNAQVSNNIGGSGHIAAVRGGYVEVCDNATVTAVNNNTILGYINITVSGNSIVEAKENAVAIYIPGGDNSHGTIIVKDQAQVIAAHNYAISHQNLYYCYLSIEGGMAFAYGNEISDIINDSDFSGPLYPGVVIAWDKAAGNTNYEMYSTDDIFVSPGYASAYWDRKGSQFGISYENNANTGFIPLDVTVLSIHEPNPANFTVYPNPTNGELRIENGELRIMDVEVFDVYGRKCHVSRVAGDENWIDISHLPAGVYIVKVDGGCQKVVKQ